MVPNLRFSSFADPFRIYTLKEVLQRISFPVTVDENKLYYQIGIRSHSKGIFYKEAEIGRQIGNKRIFWIEPNCLILNIVFAWEQAVAKTSEKEVGMVASHRFPMYKVLNNSLDYIVDFFKTEKGKQLLQMASPGGAGRNKTLNQDFFLNSKIYLPSLNEQLKTSELIELIEDRIETQIKIIEDYKVLKKKISKQVIGSQKPNTHIYECLENNSSSSKESDFDEYTEGQFPIYGANGVIKHINSYLIDIPSISIVKDGAGVGRTRFLYGKYTVIGTLNYLTSKNGYDLLYLYYALDNLDFTKYIVGSGIPHIYFKDYKREMIYIPKDEKTINKIVRCLSSLDLLIHNEQNLLLYLTKQKEYLLNNMFI
ncbi:restriction endonuclease subunit S [Holdemanella biformis]|uniref:Type I restriction modification DNA specificity domain protein n=1 Tax=Holdemanella biformis DSM 3989 TaxID=518637 RepID=B7C9M0_9FIRM|nr:restriction endonuclease subunit S [Holdemanella biformis]EEC90522.1 type I restriction modification DNA specificity domain protein [Holdemanella biformis DSM 3989]